MTGMYAATREALAEALTTDHMCPCEPCLRAHRAYVQAYPRSLTAAMHVADHLIDQGWRHIDLDDDALVERLGVLIYRMDYEDCGCEDAGEHTKHIATEVLRALVEDKP